MLFRMRDTTNEGSCAPEHLLYEAHKSVPASVLLRICEACFWSLVRFFCQLVEALRLLMLGLAFVEIITL
jgi:hypothetical protein